METAILGGMIVDQFEYRPFSVEKWIFRVLLPLCIGGLILVGSQISNIEYMEANFFRLLAVVFFILCGATLCFRFSLTTVCFEPDCILIAEVRKRCIHKYSWKDLPYRYQDKNRGYIYVVCSATRLDEYEVRRYVLRTQYRYKICYDDAVIVPIKAFRKDSKKIEDIVLNTGKDS